MAGSPLPPWLSASLDHVRELAALPANWDSYGSRPIQPAALAAMRSVLEMLADAAPRPHLGPISGGALQAEWCVDGRDLEIVTRSDGSLTCLTMEGDDPDSIVVNDLDITDSVALLALARWLIGPGVIQE